MGGRRDSAPVTHSLDIQPISTTVTDGQFLFGHEMAKPARSKKYKNVSGPRPLLSAAELERRRKHRAQRAVRRAEVARNPEKYKHNMDWH